MSDDKWNQLKEDLTEDVQVYIPEEIPLLKNDLQQKEVLNAYWDYYEKEKLKPVEERKFYKDDYGGTIYAIRTPKESFVAKTIANIPVKFYNKKTDLTFWRWWGLRLPFLTNIVNDGKVPIITAFIPISWFDKKSIPWEGEEIKKIGIWRGDITIKYRWLTDTKGVYGRWESKFLIEARKKWDDSSIKSIDDILLKPQYRASLGQLDITINPIESLKVI